MRFAEWLLSAFGVEETLHGDLVEAGAGRSAAWFLCQSVMAVAVHLGRDLRRHPVLVLRAIATGWILSVAWGRLAWLWMPRPGEHVHASFVVYRLITLFVWPVIVGWIVARTHRAQAVAMVLAYGAFAILASVWTYATHDELQRVQGPYCAMVAIVILGTLAGGLLQQRRRQRGTS